MDPVTAIGLIAAVAQLIEASFKVTKIISQDREGNKHLANLSDDLIVFSEALGGFDRVLRSRAVQIRLSSSVIENMLLKSTTTVNDLGTRLGEISSITNTTLRRAKYLQHSNRLNRLQDRLKEHVAMLQTFLAITHAETFLAVARTYPQYMEVLNVEATLGSVTGPPEALSADHASLVISPQSHTRSLSNTSSDPSIFSDMSGSTNAGSLASPTTRSSLSDLSISSGDELTSTESKHLQAREILPVRSQKNQAVIRRSCRFDCHCACHEAVKPTGLGKRCGAKKHCTDPACRAYDSGIKPASKSFRNVLSDIMASRSIKVRYPINTYRLTTVGSDAIRYVKQGDLEKLRGLIESGEATTYDTASDGWNLLHTAAYHQRLPIVKYLLQLGVSTEVGDIERRKPADFALLKLLSTTEDNTTEREIVDVFSKTDDYLLDFEFTPLHIATLEMYDVSDRERPSLKALINLVDDANNAPADTDWSKWKAKYKHRSPLYNAILEYYRSSAADLPPGTKIIHQLIDKPDEKYLWGPLHWAASSGRADAMRTLAQHGADPLQIVNGASIIHASAEAKADTGLATALSLWRQAAGDLSFLEHRNRWKETALHVSCWQGGSKVRLLLEAGADPAARDENDMVPLHCAGLSEKGHGRIEAVRLLCGTTPATHVNAQDTDGRPPLFDLLDDDECVKLCLAAGAQVDLVDVAGRNALHHACDNGELASLKLMLAPLTTIFEPEGPPPSSADGAVESPTACLTGALSATDAKGNTPLMYALRNSHIQPSLLLLSLPGGMLHEPGDSDGWAPAHHAARIGDVELMQICVKHATFVKGSRTSDGKKVEVVAMEAGTWKGEIREIVRKWDYFGPCCD